MSTEREHRERSVGDGPPVGRSHRLARASGSDEPLPVLRERAVELLCEHFARDSVDVNELERRLDATQRARSADELRALLDDLPGGAVALDRSPAPSEEGAADLRLAEVEPRSRSMVFALLGGSRRRGSWTPARKTSVLAFWGGVKLDYREALLAPGVTEVQVLAVMGGVDIVVPPGIRVESEGIAVLGGFDHVVRAPPGRGAPVLRLTGLAVMGGVNVSVREPGESRREATRRRRRERRRQRRREGR